MTNDGLKVKPRPYTVLVEKDYEDGTYNIYQRLGDSMYISFFCTTDCERKMLRIVKMLERELAELDNWGSEPDDNE